MRSSCDPSTDDKGCCCKGHNEQRKYQIRGRQGSDKKVCDGVVTAVSVHCTAHENIPKESYHI